MKSGISIIASGLAGLLITFVLSAIIHTSVLLVNPTFNIRLRDKSIDSDGRFLFVELRGQGSGGRGAGPVVSKQQSVPIGKQLMVGSRSSAAGSQKGKAKSNRSEDTAKLEKIAKPARARYKQPLKEVKVVVPQELRYSMPEKTAGATSIAHSTIRGHENPPPPLNPAPSREGGFSGQTLPSGAHEESSSSQTSTEVAQSDPVQPVSEEPKTVATAANDTGGAETFLVPSNITEVKPSPGSVNKELEEVKDRKEERPVAHVDTNVADIRKEAPNKIDNASAKNEIEAKKEDVPHGEIDTSKKEPAPFNETSSSTKGDGILSHSHRSPLPDGEEKLPPLQGEGWGGDGLFSGQTLPSSDHEKSSSKQTSTEVAQVDPIQPVTEEPKTVAEAANITEVKPSPGSVNKELEEVKGRDEEHPVAHTETNVADIRKEALNKAEDTSAKNEIEAKNDEIIETGAAELKREDVAHGEIDSTKEPSPVNETSMSTSSTNEVETTRPPLEGEGWGKTSSEPKIGQIAKAEVAEKVEEPAKVVEPKAEAPPKKKPRSIPLHKMLEPEKDATIGIPIGRPVVKITAPSKKKVSSRVQGISGRAQGNGISRVTLSTNGENAVITVQNGRFLWDTVLREGKNTILASASDIEGYSATDSIAVEVLSPKNSFELSIDEPIGGEVESPVALVKGRVGDLTVETVRLILNGEFFEAPVEDQYFEKTVFLKEKENILQVEAINSAGLTARSGVLKVAVKNPIVPDILLHILCDDHDIESNPKVTLRERSQLDAEKGAVSDVNVVEMMSANEGYWEKVFIVEEARHGAYTLKVSGGRGTDCKLVVTLNSSKRKVRVFEKRLLEGEEWAVGRFLFPEGVFWDEDEWFSGRIEDKDSITKYRYPEGVTWKELKEGP